MLFSVYPPIQVDMFSYGMVLYEMLSGQRPALGHHQLQIAKKLSKGIRPTLGSLEEVQFCNLQSLLTKCWDTKPEKVGLLVFSHTHNSLVYHFQHPELLPRAFYHSTFYNILPVPEEIWFMWPLACYCKELICILTKTWKCFRTARHHWTLTIECEHIEEVVFIWTWDTGQALEINKLYVILVRA